MILRPSTLALVILSSVAVLQPASADSWRSDVREDMREIRQDRATVLRDSARLYEERAELATARARLRADWRNGDYAAVRRDERRLREEAADVRSAQVKLDATRATLNRDVHDIREDFREIRRHHHDD